jgi:UDP-2,3-diacylglucosamine pyrophosphatase LpxH
MKTLLISDLHIGFKYSRASDILDVLNDETFDKLILVGDIFDISAMMRRPYWDKHHTAVTKKILKLAKKMEVIYVIGNHDYPLMHILENTNKLAGIQIFREYTYQSGEKTIHCIHGDQFDSLSKRAMFIGDFLYYTVLKLNSVIHFVRSKFGYTRWSFSKWCKDKVKNVIHSAFSIEDKLLSISDVDVVVYGHTHMPYVKPGKVTLVNTGTFVEIATYVIEEDGEFELKKQEYYNENSNRNIW